VFSTIRDFSISVFPLYCIIFAKNHIIKRKSTQRSSEKQAGHCPDTVFVDTSANKVPFVYKSADHLFANAVLLISFVLFQLLSTNRCAKKKKGG